MNELIIQQSEALKPYLSGLQRKFLLIGLIGIAASIAGYFLDPSVFFRSYLLAFVFWVSLPLGSLAILMIHQVGGGTWGFAIRRFLEAGTRTLPLLFVFSLPIVSQYLYSSVSFISAIAFFICSACSSASVKVIC